MHRPRARIAQPGWLLAFLLLPLLAHPALAQTYLDRQAGRSGPLPHAMTPEEELIRDQIGIGHRTTPPPTAQPVRNLAEYEPMAGVLIAYPLGISTAIVAEMSEEALIYCACPSSQQSSASSQFASGGVNMANVVWFNAVTDSWWTRDYGPWFIFDAAGELAIIDPVYNRPRPNDDEIPAELGAFLGLDVYGPNLIHTGGNWMTGGHGNAISTTLVYSENPGLSVAQIEATVDDYLGIGAYHCYPDVNGEYIEHIDCWAKYLAVDKILIREVPASHSQYDEIEAAVDYFAAQTSAYGTPYQIFRAWTPGDEPYTNSLILNDKVLVPTMGGSHPDAEALAIYQAAMPGYEVLGFTGSWYSTDALHCRTHGVGDPGYLYVYSIPLPDTGDETNPYRVDATIIDYSQAGLIAAELSLYWRTGTSGPYASVALTAGGGDAYYADIPAQPIGTTVQYYLHAADHSGRVADYPLVGPDGPFTFQVQGDPAPLITGTTDLPSTEDTVGPYLVECTVTDNGAVSAVELYYRLNGGTFAAPLAMTPQGGDLYRAGIPGQPQTTQVEYYVRALDDLSHAALDPPDAPETLFGFYVAPRVTLLADDLETGSAWTHSAVTAGFNDQWHLSETRNHTAGGAWSWKCGDAGSGDYAVNLDAALVTEPVELGIDAQLTFWHWIEAETSGSYPGQAYDGGRVEVNDGSGWVLIAPVGGYPYTALGEGPFATGSGLFAGSTGWAEATFDLGALDGTVQFRFRFGSDGGVNQEGWYVDDIAIDSFQLDPQGVAALPPLPRLILRNQPNPIRGRTTIHFTLPDPTEARLRIFDATGRTVRTLLNRRLAAGEYALDWDRTAVGGQRVAPGIYFYELEAGMRRASQRMIVIR